MNNQVFENIATRTNGDIYLGVVGPVRCGKSTFITKFMQQLAIPNIENSYEQQRVIDEICKDFGLEYTNKTELWGVVDKKGNLIEREVFWSFLYLESKGIEPINWSLGKIRK